MKKGLSKSIEVMGWLFIILIIGSFFFTDLFSLTVANKIYLLVFFIAILIGNIVREIKTH